MRPGDVLEAEQISDEGFHEVDLRLNRRSWPAPARRDAARRSDWIVRTHHLLLTDPGGCWVAEQDGAMVGFATSFVRETTWFLATYAVRPSLQGRGLGREVLAAALQHGNGTLHAMLSSSADPRAVRRYHAAGFVLHPQMFLTGVVDRSTLPVITKVREGSAGDIDLMDSIDRRTRGAAHGSDHVLMLQSWRLLISDGTTGSGYAYLPRTGSVALLAATNRRTASRLLWAALAESGAEGGAEKPQTIAHVTAANSWAVDVGLAARLDLHQDGYLGLRGMDPPWPYLHHGALL